MRKHEKRPPRERGERFANTKGRKMVVIAFFFWVLVLGAAWLGSMIQYEDIQETGKSVVKTYTTGKEYTYSIMLYVFGAVVFLVLFFLFWRIFMSGMFRALRRASAFSQGIVLILCVAGICGIFIVTLFVEMNHIYLSDAMQEEWLEAFTLIGWPVVAFARVLYSAVRGLRVEKMEKRPRPER